MKRKIKKSKGILTWRLMRLFFVLLIGTAAIQINNQYSAYRLLKTEEKELLDKLDKLKEEQASLDNQIEFQNSDHYIEKIAKEQLGFIKPNQEVFKINKE